MYVSVTIGFAGSATRTNVWAAAGAPDRARSTRAKGANRVGLSKQVGIMAGTMTDSARGRERRGTGRGAGGAGGTERGRAGAARGAGAERAARAAPNRALRPM